MRGATSIVDEIKALKSKLWPCGCWTARPSTPTITLPAVIRDAICYYYSILYAVAAAAAAAFLACSAWID